MEKINIAELLKDCPSGMRMVGTSILINFEFLEDFFYRNHLDCKGLIPMGLALDATGLNIY